MKKIKKNLNVLLISILVSLIIRLFIFELYKIPSSSMEPTLTIGDYIVVNKIYYGSRLLKIRKLFNEKKIEYIRSKGISKITRGDVFVFNWPDYNSLNNPQPNMFGACVVKRCYGIPGDNVVIRLKDARDEDMKSRLFPHDSTLHWTVSNYGPLFVPGKGKTILLNPKNAFHYKDILHYEGYITNIKNDSVFLNNKYYFNYTFTHNYYFMKGDNFYGSEDSRYWGFVPEENIIGKVGFVLFSHDEDGFKWNRFFKRIH